MSAVLVGSNPGLLVFEGDRAVGAASVWQVDWSIWGTGDVLIVADQAGWRTIGTDEHLARILFQVFTRHFPELASFGGVPLLGHTADVVRVDADLVTGLLAVGGGVEVELREIKDRRPYVEPAFGLGNRELGLSNLYAPCASGRLTIDGRPVPGSPRCRQVNGRWTSSAYLAVAEVWTDPTGMLSAADPSAMPPTARARHLRAIDS